MLVWIEAAIAVGLLLYLLKLQYQKTSKVEEMFPGPFSFPLIGNVIQVIYQRNNLERFLLQISYFYKRSMRLWIFNDLIILVNTADDVQKVLGNMTYIQKTWHYDLTKDWLGKGLLTSEGEKWHKHRKALTPAFHYSLLDNFLRIFQKNVNVLCDILETRVGKGNFELTDLMALCSLDNLISTSMGIEMNCQLNPKSDFVSALKSLLNISLTRAMSPWLWPSFIFYLTSLGKRYEKSLGVINGVCNKVIMERMQELKTTNKNPVDNKNEYDVKKRKVFLDILIENSESAGFTLEDIRDEVNTFMLAGHDTVTAALTFCLYSLAQNQDIQQKVYEEIEQVLSGKEENGRQDYQNLKYLEMVIKESLRLFPSVQGFGRAISEDLHLDKNTVIPKGSTVVVLPHLLHKNESAWEKPHEFYPEHFTQEACLKRHPYQYVPFSAGPRNCIGQQYAFLSMKSTLSAVVKRFKILPSNPSIPIKQGSELIITSQTGVHVQVERR